MSFSPVDLTHNADETHIHIAQQLPGSRWIPVLRHDCDFGKEIFSRISLNLIENPNITSSHLFRADILFDSQGERGFANIPDEDGETPGFPRLDISCFTEQRILVRKLIPRNPQLDRPISQTCYLLGSEDPTGVLHSVIILQPHCDRAEDLPWYHPSIQAVAYGHIWRPESQVASNALHSTDLQRKGQIAIYYQLFPDQDTKLSSRLLRTAQNLLSVQYKHGQGRLAGYTKKVHHDQLITQQRVQDTYSELKIKHAKRLCDAWVEQTEPSKHVFEDLGIAAFLIELWKDMYAPPGSRSSNSNLPPFPGFVDIGCGNGILTEVLLLAGYQGQGFDARRRKTWSILSSNTQSRLKETLFVPRPLFDLYPLEPGRQSILSKAKTMFSSPPTSSLEPPRKSWHNCMFPNGTFIISNHADELTPWTPLLGYLMESPFLAIPCCSHNLSGDRFRAPSQYNSNTADAQAPTFFAANKPKTKAKSVAITIPHLEGDDDGTSSNPAFAPGNIPLDNVDTSADPPACSDQTVETKLEDLSLGQGKLKAESGDLKELTPGARAKQPSAYASLCEWVTYLSREVGYDVEREMLRIPSTRNVGLIGRTWRGGFKQHGSEERKARVLEIIRREGADGKAFVKRCEGVLAKNGGKDHG